MTSDKTKWSALAMLYDGEGCFHIAKQFQPDSNCYGYRLDMPICMTSLKIMKWLVSNFGGKFTAKGRDNRYQNAKQLYVWYPGGDKRRKEGFLLGILPYAIEKDEQIRVALEFLRLPWGTGDAKNALYLKLRELKKQESVETNTSDSEVSEKRESELLSDWKSELAVTQVA